MRDTPSVCDVEEREDARGNEQSKDDGCANHHFLLVLFFRETLLLLGFLLFSKPPSSFVDDALPLSVAEAEVDQLADLLHLFLR